MNTKLSEKAKIWTQKLVSYGLWLMVIILAFSVFQNAKKAADTKNQIQREREKVAKMKVQNEELEKRVSEAQSLSYIEKQVRDRLGLVKAGESIVILPDESVLRSLAPNVDHEKNTLPDPNWKKWEKLFF